MPQSLKAKLVMEAKGVAPSVRAGGFSSGWSKLYQAEDYYLDFMLRIEGKSLTLIGQVIQEGASAFHGRAYLYGDVERQETAFGSLGGFMFEIQEGQDYQFDVMINDQHIVVDSIAC